MRIDMQVDVAPLILRLKNGERRLAYAAVNALNSTAKRVQQAEFQHIGSLFEIRRPAFFFGQPERPGGTAARIRPFASVKQGRPYVEIAIAPPSGRGLINRRLLLPTFEAGGQRPIFTPGAHHVAVPITGGPARPTFSSQIPKEFTFGGMRLAAYRGGKRVKRAGQRAGRTDQTVFGTEGRATLPSETARSIQWKGLHRTFTILGTDRGFPGGVFQRTGPKQRDIRLVYAFRPPMALDGRLDWIGTAETTANLWLREELEAEAVKAVAHSRGQGV